MPTIHTRSHAGPDGVLKLDVSTGVADADVEIDVHLPKQKLSRDEWLAFIEETAGQWQGAALERPAQPSLETRDEIK